MLKHLPIVIKKYPTKLNHQIPDCLWNNAQGDTITDEPRQLIVSSPTFVTQLKITSLFLVSQRGVGFLVKLSTCLFILPSYRFQSLGGGSGFFEFSCLPDVGQLAGRGSLTLNRDIQWQFHLSILQNLKDPLAD